eukprot:Nk52_evm12s217 gene=Nk52_evmTU12s217
MLAKICAFVVLVGAVYCSFVDAAPTPDADSGNQLKFEVNGLTSTVAVPSPDEFLDIVLGEQTSQSEVNDLGNSQSYMFLATSSRNTAMNPALFTNDRFIGYDARIGEPALKSAFAKDLQPDSTATSYSIEQFALSYDSETEAKLDKTAVGVEGGFTGGSANFGLEDSSENSKESKTVKLKVFMRRDIKTVSLPFGETIHLKDDAQDLLNKNPMKFLEVYGTHAVASKTYGCISTLEGMFTFDSAADKQKFTLGLGADMTSGSFGAKVSTDIQDIASKSGKSYKLTLTLVGDVTDISPAEGQFSNLMAWATALKQDFSPKCEQLASENKVTVKSIGAFPWSKVLASSDANIPSFSIDDMTNISIGNKRKALAQDGYSRLMDYSGKIDVSYVSNRGHGGCPNEESRDELKRAKNSYGELNLAQMNLDTLSWMTKEMENNFVNISSAKVKAAIYDYKHKVNGELVKFARTSNTLYEHFIVEVLNLADKPIVTLRFQTTNPDMKLCVYGDTETKAIIQPRDKPCGNSKEPWGVRTFELKVKSSEAGILTGTCVDDKNNPVKVTAKPYEAARCQTLEMGGDKVRRGVKLIVKPDVNRPNKIENGFVPCDFARE